MATLNEIAQQAMDLYYQEFKTDNQFFTIEHFQEQCAMVYAKLLQDEFMQNKQIAKQETGFSSVELSPDWFQQIEVIIGKTKDCENEYSACLPQDIFSFSFDSMASGIQFVAPVDCDVKQFIKIGFNDTWQLDQLPSTRNTYYYVLGKRVIVFKKPNCRLDNKKVKIYYIPDINLQDKDAYIPSTKALPILNTTLQIMIAAKQGVVIKMVDNQNENNTLEGEIDQDTLKK